MASLSAKVVELLKTKFGLDMEAIYRFELQELQLLDVDLTYLRVVMILLFSRERRRMTTHIIAGAGAIPIDPTCSTAGLCNFNFVGK